MNPLRLLPLLLLPLVACVHLDPRAEPGNAELRHFFYVDDAGLTVNTTGAHVEQPVSRRVALRAAGVVDSLAIDPAESTGTDGGHGHHHRPAAQRGFTGAAAAVDAVSSASIPVASATAETFRELRTEVQLGGRVLAGGALRPSRVDVMARGSFEPDYTSWSASIAGRTELFQRNLVLAGYLGYGSDVVTPEIAPAGQEALWPGGHQRVSGGFTASQALSPRLVVYGGAAASYQAGLLSSPYRYARVRTTLFPEAVPDDRLRATAFGQLSWYLGRRSALHLRQGAYLDSWRVFAFIPELALSKELGSGVASMSYRLYRQRAASFYEPVYDDLETYVTGDPRLGTILDHSGSVDLRWRVISSRQGPGALDVTGGYSISRLVYEQLEAAPLLSHTVSAGLIAVY